MTDPSALLALIEKLKAAPEGSEQLDVAITELMSHRVGDRGTYTPYTRSIDAAVSLVPDDAGWEIVQRCSKTSPMRSFDNPGMFYAKVGWGNTVKGYSDSPAIALVIAALKARAQ